MENKKTIEKDFDKVQYGWLYKRYKFGIPIDIIIYKLEVIINYLISPLLMICKRKYWITFILL